VNEMHRQYHPVSNLFPLMQGADFEALKQDISEHGQLEPIWLHPDGSIIDGRNRHRACIELGITPHFRTWDGAGSLVSFVVSLNLHRRHLDAGQRGMIGLKVKDALAEEIAAALPEQKRAAAETRWYGPESETMHFVQLDKVHVPDSQRDARAEAAAVMNVGKGTMARAEQVAKHAPDLADKVLAGTVKLNAAYREMKRRSIAEAPSLPSRKYRVIYADPPWSYGNTMPPGTTQPDDYYPLMRTSDICALPIRDLAEQDSVLFLWTTSPHLPEAFDVISAWGFEYKTSFVWDKVKHNMGHYNSVRHELLLVCTRGSCTPDVPKLFDSVQTIERTEHSVKPEEFRTIIDTIYPYGKRIELFARKKIEGWETWGNESGS